MNFSNFFMDKSSWLLSTNFNKTLRLWKITILSRISGNKAVKDWWYMAPSVFDKKENILKCILWMIIISFHRIISIKQGIEIFSLFIWNKAAKTVYWKEETRVFLYFFNRMEINRKYWHRNYNWIFQTRNSAYRNNLVY